MNLPVADDHLSFAPKDRLDQRGNVARIVLTVGVGVDHDICATFEGRVDSRRKGHRETAVDRQSNDRRSGPLRHLDGVIFRSVVDNDDLDLVESLNLPRQGFDGLRQMGFLVPSWDLNDELHLSADRCHKVAQQGVAAGGSPTLRLPGFDTPTILAGGMNDTAAHTRTQVIREGRLALTVFGVIEILIGLALAAMAPLSILAGFLATSVDLWVIVPSVALYCVMAAVFIVLGAGVIRARRWACALSLSLGWVWLLTGICTVVLVWLVTPTVWSDLALSSGLSRTVAGWVGVGINLFLVVAYLLLPGAFVFFFRSPRTLSLIHI